jgi:hypothetical protein
MTEDARRVYHHDEVADEILAQYPFAMSYGWNCTKTLKTIRTELGHWQAISHAKGLVNYHIDFTQDWALWYGMVYFRNEEDMTYIMMKR